jgi:hypothetical protein
MARQECPLMINTGRAKGVQRRDRAKRNRKQGTRCVNTILLTPPLESAQTKHRPDCLRPMDEVFMLGLGATVMMAPVVVSRLDMYRTNVLMYRTMVLLARPTKVRH